jgi:arylsulfatase A-like enzyme/Tfp pilus assembly protein PilF
VGRKRGTTGRTTAGGATRDRAEPPAVAAAPTPARARRARLAVAALALLGLGGVAVLLARGRAALPRAEGADVLLVSIDTLRADAVGAYGRGGAGTTWLDRAAATGVRFAQARAHNVVTLPSHATLLSGRLPFEHGVRDNSGFRVPTELPTLATVLKARGYRTGAFVSAFVLDSRFGLDRGFEVYDDRLGGGEGQGAFAIPERSAARSVDAARRWLDEAPGAPPSFLFLHLYEPHAPYEPPEPFASRFAADAYQGEVAAADAALEPLLRPLLEGRARPTVVVLTSDHGEGRGDHGEQTHGVFAYEATLRVPLVLWAGDRLRPRVVEEAVRLVDIVPTVLELLGVAPPEGLPGRSLLPSAVGRALPPADTYFEALSASLDRGWAPLHGVVSGPLKLIDLPLPELYDLAADPHERQNLADGRGGERTALAARLASLRAADPGAARRTREDAQTLERLRTLGYVAGGAAAPKARYGPEDDPKRLIALERREAEILRLVRAGDHAAARTLCLESLAERPDMSLTWTQLASIERARGDLGAAVAAARRALALRPGDPATAAILAGSLVESGGAAEARQVLGPFLAAQPPDPDLLLIEGMALARLGQAGEALAAFDRVRALDPGNARARVNAGTVHLMNGAPMRAAEAFAAALAIDPSAAAAHNGLGVVAAQAGRAEEAVEHWKRAVALDPRDYQGLFNLGATLRRLGRTAEARPYLEAYLRVAPAGVEGRDLARVRAWLAGGSY